MQPPLLYIPEHFHQPQKKPCISHHSSTFFLPSSPWQPLFSVSTGLPILGFQMNGITICDLLCLAPPTRHNASKAHPCHSMHYSIPFLLPNNSPLHVSTRPVCPVFSCGPVGCLFFFALSIILFNRHSLLNRRTK